jgi:UDP-N-acetylglucosamine enolpyruvyl transferase
MKSLDKFSKKAKKSNNRFIPILSAALFIGMLSLMSAPYITNVKNVTAIVAFLTAAVTVLACGRVAKAVQIRAIDEFSLPISLIAGMAAAIIYTNIFI